MVSKEDRPNLEEIATSIASLIHFDRPVCRQGRLSASPRNDRVSYGYYGGWFSFPEKDLPIERGHGEGACDRGHLLQTTRT
jgi:hypothetical protein